VRLLLIAAFVCASVRAHDAITTQLTWSKEISRIVYKRCGGCHQGGGSSMSLITYAEARPWAKAIRDEVLSRRMPPWGAVKGFRELRRDPSLTQDEITRVAEWVEGGAPEGDAKYLPEPPMRAKSEVLPATASIALGTVLTRPVVLSGVQPVGAVPDAKITATLPDGRVEPLIWLYEYKGTWKHAFWFAEPLALPAGTRVNMPAGVSLRGLISAPKPAR
jgi:hypothetical protein